MPRSAYELHTPATPCSCVVFASPHSARDYSLGFLAQSVLAPLVLRSSEDAFVDQLFDYAPNAGAPLLLAGAPRAYVDLNRSAEELDPALIEGIPKRPHNPRVRSGLGVIPRVVANGKAIYSGKLPKTEAQRRIDQYWHPYHARLARLLEQSRARYGKAVLIDCHSMPHDAVRQSLPAHMPSPEIVIGDRYGAAADSTIVGEVETAFRGAGFRVARNTPFAGAYVTQHYGRPAAGCHAIQIEIDRSLYMNEATITPRSDFEQFRNRLRSVILRLAAIGSDSASLAAE